jgi:DNA polymerase III delta prime subunit
MLTTKYKPTHLENFVGNKPAIKSLNEWLKSSTATKCALISGSNGTGKTLLIELILRDYNVLNVSNDEEINQTYFNKITTFLTMKTDVNKKKNVIVFHDIDTIGYNGFIRFLVDCIKETSVPIVCSCDDRYKQSLKPILKGVLDVKLQKPLDNEIFNFIGNIVLKEKIKINTIRLKSLISESNGDIRSIMNKLEFGTAMCSKKDVASSNIFETTGKLLSIDEDFQRKYETYWLANDIHCLMIHENYVTNQLVTKDEVRRLDSLYEAAHALSCCDTIDSSRYENGDCSWELEDYTTCNAIMATNGCNKRNNIQFPQFLGRIKETNKRKREKFDYDNAKFDAISKTKVVAKKESKKKSKSSKK